MLLLKAELSFRALNRALRIDVVDGSNAARPVAPCGAIAACASPNISVSGNSPKSSDPEESVTPREGAVDLVVDG